MNRLYCKVLPTRVWSAALLLIAAPAAAQHTEPGVPPPMVDGAEVLFVPEIDDNLQSYDQRQYQQEQSAWRYNVFHDFKFSDRFKESGITFKHKIVDDAGKYPKQVHYDHGGGFSAADVDRDGLIDVYFVSHLGGNQLWKNLGGGKFQNITTESGVALTGGVSVTASFADVDNDGDPDLYVSTVRTGNALFENDGTGKFKNITESAGLKYSGHSGGATFFDYDRDGLLDLFVDNLGKYTTDVWDEKTGYWVGVTDGFSSHLMPSRVEDSKLYHNLGGNKFEDVTNAMGVQENGFDGDASFNDINEDGYPDLYVTCMQGDNHYYENDGGQRFIDKTAEVFPKTSWGSMGLKFVDWNNDGLVDLYVTDMHSDMGRYQPPAYEKSKSLIPWDETFTQGSANNIFGNSFFQKNSDGVMEEISDRIGVENYWPWGTSAGDFNADGWEDFIVTSGMNYSSRYTANYLLLNNAGQEFLDSEFITGVEPRVDGTSVLWFELECSGADATHPRCKGLTGHKYVYASRGSKSSLVFDLENDGDLDIVTIDFNDYPQVLVNNLSEKKQANWLSITLSGRESNRDGLGAKVTVRVSGGRTFTKWNDGKSGYLSQASVPLYFGLGDTSTVREVEVLWPSGRRQTLTEGLEGNTTLRIREPTDD